MDSYKLTYFDVRGVAEVSRFLFAIAKVPYEDFRFSFTFGVPGDFSTLERAEFDAAKAAGDLDASLGKAPMLEVNGVKIGQSKAIERYLAQQFGLMGSTPLEAALIDSICETNRDVKDAYQKVRAIKDADEKAAGMVKWFAEDLPGWCKLLEKSLPAAPGPFFVGSKVSLADVTLFQLLAAPKGFFDNAEGAAAAFQECPRIKAALEAAAAIPELQAWIASRPDTMM